MNIDISIYSEKKYIPFEQYDFKFVGIEDLAGKIEFVLNENMIQIETKSLISDIFSLFYSINDFLEFEFSSLELNNSIIDFCYEKYDDMIIIESEILEKCMSIEPKLFCNSLLDKSYSFFNSLNKAQNQQEYDLYLGIINSLKFRVQNFYKLLVE